MTVQACLCQYVINASSHSGGLLVTQTDGPWLFSWITARMKWVRSRYRARLRRFSDSRSQGFSLARYVSAFSKSSSSMSRISLVSSAFCLNRLNTSSVNSRVRGICEEMALEKLEPRMKTSLVFTRSEERRVGKEC